MTDKHPFAIDVAIARLREVIRSFPRAALFALAEEGQLTARAARCLYYLYPYPGCGHFVLRAPAVCPGTHTARHEPAHPSSH